jgi:hypothetical protein
MVEGVCIIWSTARRDQRTSRRHTYKLADPDVECEILVRS